MQDLEKKGAITPIVNDLDATFGGTIEGDHLYMETNWQAPNRRIIDVDLKNPAREHWRTVVPEASSVIENFRLAGGKVFVNYLENVSTHVKVFEPSGKQVREITFPTLGTASNMSGEWNQDEAFYSFSSFAQASNPIPFKLLK